MPRAIRSRFFFVSPWLLAAATGLLILIIVTFTFSTIQRDKRMMTQSMLQKGAILIRVIGSGAKGAYLADMQHGFLTTGSWEKYVQDVIDRLSGDPDVHFLMVIDQNNRIVAHSDRQKIGSIIQEQVIDGLKHMAEKTGGQSLLHRTAKMDTFGSVFLVARPCLFFRPVHPAISRFTEADQDTTFSSALSSDKNNIFSPHSRQFDTDRVYFAVVGLNNTGFEKSLRQLRFQASMLALAMLLVGVGGWLSLSAVQGYRLSQKALSDIRAFTGLLIARLPVGIIAINQQGLVSTWNQAAEDMTGISTQKALGSKVSQLLPPQLAVFFLPLLPVEELKETVTDSEVRLVTEKGEMSLHCRVIDLHDQDKAYRGQVLLMSDMTQVKELEAEMRENERLAAVGRMAAGVAHEVRNPLSSIKGLALLLKNKFSRQSSEFETTGLLIQEVERMNRTISELLSFARPGSLEFQSVDILELLNDVLQLVAADTSSENVDIFLHCDESLPHVRADQDRLRQVIINILLNGVQAMEHGGKLEISVCSSTDGRSVELQFTDTGKGIAPEHVGHVFFPYYTTKTGGTGIGLAISQKIIADHGGTIRLESEVGKGTTVYVLLPVTGGE